MMEKDRTSISITAWIISLLALCVSLWQGYETRRHHRLSVRPLLSQYVSLHPGADKLGFSVSNEGLGPAIMKKCKVAVDKTVINVPDTMAALKKAKGIQVLRKGV
jgi:hypothetical protein